MKMQTIRQAFYKSIPVMAGYIVLGTGFGILMRNAGYGVLWTAACVVVLQVWKRNSLISILTGTAVYMILIQLVF